MRRVAAIPPRRRRLTAPRRRGLGVAGFFIVLAGIVVRLRDRPVAVELVEVLRRAVDVLIALQLGALVFRDPGARRSASPARTAPRDGRSAPSLKVLDKGGAGVLHLLAGQNRRVLAGGLQRRTRQAREELVRAHVRQEAVGADRIAGDRGRRCRTVGAVLAARQHVDQNRARRLPQRFRSKPSLPSSSMSRTA